MLATTTQRRSSFADTKATAINRHPELEARRRSVFMQPAGPARRCAVTMLITAILAGAAPHQGLATDLGYRLLSPSFGGTDPQPYSYAQYESNQRLAAAAAVKQAAVAAVAAAKATTATSPSQQFADSIISQLQSLVARNVALQIANAAPGKAGTIQSNGSTITYVNTDGQLNVSITTSAGVTSFSVPSVN